MRQPREEKAIYTHTYILASDTHAYLDLQHEPLHALQRPHEGALDVASVELRPAGAPGEDGLSGVVCIQSLASQSLMVMKGKMGVRVYVVFQ